MRSVHKWHKLPHSPECPSSCLSNRMFWLSFYMSWGNPPSHLILLSCPSCNANNTNGKSLGRASFSWYNSAPQISANPTHDDGSACNAVRIWLNSGSFFTAFDNSSCCSTHGMLRVIKVVANLMRDRASAILFSNQACILCQNQIPAA